MHPKLLFVTLFLVLVSCTSQPESTEYIIRLQVDGSEYAYRNAEPLTVGQFLDEINIELGPLDRVNPETYTQVFDDILITVTRVQEDEYCEDVEVPYRTETVLVEGVPPGEERRGQTGESGVEQVCYRVEIINGIRGQPVQTSRIVTKAPVNEIIYVGPSEETEPIPINGTLAYINNQNAWFMRDSSTTKRPITVTGDLDARVFSLEPSGRKLLIARNTETNNTFGNQLWFINDITEQEPDVVELTPRNVLYADWVPDRSNTISYATGEARQAPPGWKANNDLTIMRIDPETGDHIDIEEILDGSSGGGLYGWWGTPYKWSPDGSQLAWIRADSVGLVNLTDNTLGPALLTFPVLTTLQDWSWRTTISWSGDSSLIAATVHGASVGAELPENSPVFDITVAATDGSFSANLVNRAGIWSTPRFSPEIIRNDSQFTQGHIAYLKARDWDESIRGDYDLVVADRDGSNARVIFPQSSNQPGLSAQQFAQDFTWSPDGRQIAFIYLGNLWVIDVETEVAHQLTQDGGASKPVWTR
jgi:resuscitation-promoting factor RpfB